MSDILNRYVKFVPAELSLEKKLIIARCALAKTMYGVTYSDEIEQYIKKTELNAQLKKKRIRAAA